MIITTRNAHNSFIEIIIENDGVKLVADVTNIHGDLSHNIIEQVENLLEDLKDYQENRKL